MTRIAVIGAGSVGATLAGAWEAKGHEVAVGVRHPDKAGRPATSVPDALTDPEVVVLCLPGPAARTVVEDNGKALAGRVVIDATNDLSGGHTAESLSVLPFLADTVPSALAYRAFNSVGWENMADPVVAGERTDLFYAGAASDRRSVVESLIADVGFRPVYVGSGPDALMAVDRLATLWFALAFGQKRGRRLALRLLSED